MELTDEEKGIIITHRKIIKDAENKHLLKNELISTTHKFNEFLSKERRLPSFSTFLDEFKYGGDNPQFMYLKTVDLLGYANKLISGD